MTERRLRILVVEDHSDTKETLVALLESLAYWVESCADAASALERMRHDGLDVLLTDVRLLDMDAWHFLAALTKQGNLPPRVVTMSAYDAVETRRQSEIAGCFGHLVKPFGPEELTVMLG